MEDTTSRDTFDAPPYELNMRELLEGDPIRLRYVWRYSTCRVNHQESVAEHSFYVAFYAALIGQWLQAHPTEQHVSSGEILRHTHRLNWELLMVRAVVHDLEEARTGDMPRFFKYSSDTLRNELDHAANAAFNQCVNRLVDAKWAERLAANWQLAKDSRLEGKVIAFADYLSVLSYVVQEFKSGNRDATEHISGLRDYYALFVNHDNSFAPIRPLVEQVGVFIQETFPDDEYV